MQQPQKKLIRLVYENGVFRPTEPVDYEDGAEVVAELLTQREREERLIEQLYEEGLLVRPPKEDGDDDIDDKALLAKLHASLRGTTLSDAVIEDREQARSLLGNLLEAIPENGDNDIDEITAMERIRKAFSGAKSLSDIVIEDREDRA